jgi:hypothetical protein
MKSVLSKLVLLTMLVFPVFYSGCYITEIIQSAVVEVGGVFTATITVTDMNAEQNNAHKGVLAIHVPEDWSFIDGTYDTPMGVGEMVLDTSANPVWGDIDTVIAPVEGFKWINLLSDEGYFHDAELVYEATVNLQVGETTGDFPIGYLVTVNTGDMLKFLNDQENDQELAGTDTSMNHMVTVNPATGIKETRLNGSPAEYYLYQNFPNPFNPSTTINYSIVEGTDVKLIIYDVSAKEVAVLVNGYKPAGNYSINFSDKKLSSGVYYYRISMNGFTETRKMLLMK